MRKRLLIMLFMLIPLCFSACRAGDQSGSIDPAQLFQTVDFGLSEGHFYFAGKVLNASAVPKQITYYEEEAEKNTFYRVQVTDDYFGCMPAGSVTVCVFGSAENFPQRAALTAGKEYLFDTSFWVDEAGAVFLLPTFYRALSAREGEQLSYTDENGRATAGTYAAYRAELEKRAAAAGYSAQTVWNAIGARLELAAGKDAAYFAEKGFTRVDAADQAAAIARKLKEKMEPLPIGWAAIREVLSWS